MSLHEGKLILVRRLVLVCFPYFYRRKGGGGKNMFAAREKYMSILGLGTHI